MKIGIIGGSGLEKEDILENIEELEIDTPYGKPSSKIKKGILNETEIYILSRHGLNHEITPSNVNNKANIYVLVQLGCKYIIATSAVGSLKESIAPGDFVIANQFIDFTKHRDITFFNDFKKGIKHTSLADPYSEKLRQYLIDSCEELNLKNHKIGTILTIEGPRFSTRAESFMFKNFAHVINMSTAPEAILAKEAGVEYAVIAMSTDYDCWKKTETPVTWEEIERVMKQNSENVKKVIIKTIEKISGQKIVNREMEFIKSKIRTIPNFPKQGIMFRDITTLFKDSEGMKKVIEIFHNRYKDKQIDVVCGIEARGFILGGILAEKLNCGFIPIRKKGKLPSETVSQEYLLEYGTDTVEMHRDAIKLGQKVLLIDDLIATGGTAKASCELIEKLGGEIVECSFVIDLPDLKGKEKISKHPVFSIVEFVGE
jgi:5'-methylthioadenosine phosphorylase|tara:strand:- start:2850 stop:4136 length:1287 start_codon:yes stop_codon:yes gene_type:complete